MHKAEYRIEGYRVWLHNGNWNCECPDYNAKPSLLVYRRSCRHVVAVETALHARKEVKESGPKVVSLKGRKKKP